MKQKIDGIILAGGASQRMGQDKASVMLEGKPLLVHQIELMRPEVEQLWIVGNQFAQEQSKNNIHYCQDFFTQREGPLSGLLAALTKVDAEIVWVMPCDNFGLDAQVAGVLLEALEKTGADIAYLYDGQRDQPLIAMLKKTLEPSLRKYINEGGRAVFKWYAQEQAVKVHAPENAKARYNLNRPEDLEF